MKHAKEAKQVSLTEGPILKSLLNLAFPIMISSFLGTLYNIVDMAWVGLLGANAVAGVGAGGMYVWLSSGFSTMTRMGGQVFAAQELGKGRREEARQYAKAAVQLVILMGVLYGAVCLAFTDQLIGFFQLSDAESVAIGIQYTKITCGLILFSFLNFTLTGLYTAQGDSRTPFVANFAGMAANIVLDPLFIFGAGPIPGMQAAGAAVATVCSQIIVTMVLVVCTLKSRKDADNENILKHMHLTTLCKKWYYREVCRIGIPSALQSIVYCGISMVLTRMVSSFGSAAVAAQRVGGQIESISWNTADGFGTAMNAFAGQNYGAGKMDRVKKSYHISLAAVGTWGLIITVVFLVAPEPISRIFFHEAESIQAFTGYLQVISVCEAFMCVELLTIGTLCGLGLTKLCSVVSISLTSIRIPLAWILSSTSLGVLGVWWALSLSSVAKGCIFYLVFRKKSSDLAKDLKREAESYEH